MSDQDWRRQLLTFCLDISGATLSGGAPGQFSSTLIEHVLRTGSMEDHIRKVLVPTYKARQTTMQQAIEEYLIPLGVKVDTGRYYTLWIGNETKQIMGGFFVYIAFPEGVTADDVAAVALKDYNLRFLASGAMRVRGINDSGNETSKDLKNNCCVCPKSKVCK